MKTKLLLLFTVVCMRAFCQLPNAGFESWTNVFGSPFPTGWSGSPFGVDTTNDATEGNSALLIWTWYNYSPGYVYNGANAASWDYAKAGDPYTQKPFSLEGMYKFDSTNVDSVDSVMVVVFLKKYNTVTHLRDTVAFGLKMLPHSPGYIPFSVPVVDRMPGTDPDSIVVLLSTQSRAWIPGNATNVCRMPFMDCAYTWFDDLRLNTASGITDLSSLFSPAAYPNPTDEFISFKYKTKPDGAYETVSIYDNTGKLCYKGKINSMHNRIKVKNFGRGMYHYTIVGDDNAVMSKGKFTVTD